MRTFVLFLLSLTIQLHGQDHPQTARPHEHWNLRELFRDAAHWEAQAKHLTKSIEDLGKYKNTITSDNTSLKKTLDRIAAIQKETNRLQTYAYLQQSVHLNDRAAQDRLHRADKLVTTFQNTTAFLKPELAALGADHLRRLVQDPLLKDHQKTLRDILDYMDHTLDADAEAVLSAAHETLWGTFLNYDRLVSSGMLWKEVTLSSGEVLLADKGARSKRIDNAEDRKLLSEAYLTAWHQMGNAIGEIYNTRLKGHVFLSRSRRYPGVLEHVNASAQIPNEVTDTLVQVARENLDLLHRYLSVRGRIMGRRDPSYGDLRLPSITSQKRFTIEDAKRITSSALAPFGKEYIDILEHGFQNDWMHAYPAEHKDRGAFVVPVYDVHPYVMLNFDHTFAGVGEFAHEWGHAVHFELAKANNGYDSFEATTYVAELASTTNEIMVENYMLATDDDPQNQLYYLMKALGTIHGSFFRTVMTTEFEKKAIDAVSSNTPLTGDEMNEVYLNLLRDYYGHHVDVMQVDPKYAIEWAMRIQIMYKSYYIYKYATSIAGATAFAERMHHGETNAAESYIHLLKAGQSDYGYPLLKKNGVDLANKSTYDPLFKRMARLLEKAEDLLSKTSEAEHP
ncbi:Oligoendopeptidase F family protein [Sulfidibacter corallicola]